MIGECEMTGKKNVPLFKVKIEGTIMNVSKECIKYGELLREPSKQKYFTKVQSQEPEEIISADASSKIKQAREKAKLTQQEFAKQLGLKESVLQHIESGHLQPRLDVAKKIQRKLHIKIVEKVKEVEFKKASKEDSKPLTMEEKVLQALQKANQSDK